MDPDQRIKQLQAQLDTMKIGVNCTYEQHYEICTEITAANICIDMDQEILDELLNEIGTVDKE